MPVQGACLAHATSLAGTDRLRAQGTASYYSVRLPTGETLEDIVWWYRTPQLECAEIKGCVAFYNEKVDIAYLDWDVGTHLGAVVQGTKRTHMGEFVARGSSDK